MTRYYFTHGPDYAAVEDIEQARKYREAGWRLVTHDVFMFAWQARDMERLRAMRAPITGAMVWTYYDKDGKEIRQ